MIPLFKVGMSPAVMPALEPVLQSGYIGQGPKVEEFEAALQHTLGLPRRPVTVNSATAGLDLALQLIGVGPGDYVISTPITCLASNTVIHNRGATILWCDVDDEGNMDPDAFEHLLDVLNEKRIQNVKAVMAVDWAGRQCDFNSLRAILCLKGFERTALIEDAAHAFGAMSNEHFPIGIEGGDYIVWSFQAIKHLTCGDGGALQCPEAQVERAKLLRWYGLDRKNSQAMRCTQTLKEVGHKYHMNDISATIGLANIPTAIHNVARCRQVAEWYSEDLPLGHGIISTPWYNSMPSWWLYTLRVENRESFMSHMASKGVETSLVHARNDHQPALRAQTLIPLDGVDQFARTEVCIPCGFWVEISDFYAIREAIFEWQKTSH